MRKLQCSCSLAERFKYFGAYLYDPMYGKNGLPIDEYHRLLGCLLGLTSW